MSIISDTVLSDPTGDDPEIIPGRTGRARQTWSATRPYRPVLVLTLALVVFVSIAYGTFLTGANLQNMLTAVAVLWIIAMGQTFALITGGADLSSAAIATLVTIVVAKMVGHVPGAAAVTLGLLVGASIGGLTNGLLIGRMRLSFFVVTLGTGTALGGVVTLWSKGQSFLVNSPLINALSINTILGIATPIWIMAITLGVCLYIQRRTYFGRNLYAIGGSRTAARLSGIRTERTIVLVYAFLGLCAAFGGIIGLGLSGSANPQVDPTLPLQAIAAVLLGGTSLFGGAGSVVGTALGVLFIGVLQNTLDLAGVPSAWQQVVTGVILIVAVAALPDATGAPRAVGWMRLKRRHHPADA